MPEKYRELPDSKLLEMPWSKLNGHIRCSDAVMAALRWVGAVVPHADLAAMPAAEVLVQLHQSNQFDEGFLSRARSEVLTNILRIRDSETRDEIRRMLPVEAPIVHCPPWGR